MKKIVSGVLALAILATTSPGGLAMNENYESIAMSAKTKQTETKGGFRNWFKGWFTKDVPQENSDEPAETELEGTVTIGKDDEQNKEYERYSSSKYSSEDENDSEESSENEHKTEPYFPVGHIEERYLYPDPQQVTFELTEKQKETITKNTANLEEYVKRVKEEHEENKRKLFDKIYNSNPHEAEDLYDQEFSKFVKERWDAQEQQEQFVNMFDEAKAEEELKCQEAEKKARLEEQEAQRKRLEEEERQRKEEEERRKKENEERLKKEEEERIAREKAEEEERKRQEEEQRKQKEEEERTQKEKEEEQRKQKEEEERKHKENVKNVCIGVGVTVAVAAAIAAIVTPCVIYKDQIKKFFCEDVKNFFDGISNKVNKDISKLINVFLRTKKAR